MRASNNTQFTFEPGVLYDTTIQRFVRPYHDDFGGVVGWDARGTGSIPATGQMLAKSTTRSWSGCCVSFIIFNTGQTYHNSWLWPKVCHHFRIIELPALAVPRWRRWDASETKYIQLSFHGKRRHMNNELIPADWSRLNPLAFFSCYGTFSVYN